MKKVSITTVQLGSERMIKCALPAFSQYNWTMGDRNT